MDHPDFRLQFFYYGFRASIPLGTSGRNGLADLEISKNSGEGLAEDNQRKKRARFSL